MNLFHRNCHNYFRSYNSLDPCYVVMDWQMTLLTFIAFRYLWHHDSTRSQNAKISMNTQTEIANFSGLGRVLTEMRLVKVSNTERQELNNAHSNLREIYNLGLQAKLQCHSTHFKCIMLLMIAVILGLVR